MADINQVQLPDGSQYNITDTTSGYATQSYVQSAISGITKATIGLGNVDNTSDANKPVSTAQQTALDGKTNTSMVAYVESSTIATKRYEIGDQFILSGVLYTATAIIANGGTITVGTNCTASDTITEQLKNNPTLDRRIVLISDSYGTTVNGVTSFADVIEATYIDDDTIFENHSLGSLGIVPNGTTDGVEAHIRSLISGGTLDTPNTVTELCIAMGANDIGRDSQLPTYFASLCPYLKETFPNAVIYFAFIGTTHNDTIANRIAAINAYKSNSIKYGCKYITGSENIMSCGANLQTDTVHPNQSGANYLAECVAYGLLNYEYSYYQEVSAPITLAGKTIPLVFEFMNELVSVRTGQVDLSGFTLPSSFTAGSYNSAKPIRGNGAWGFTAPFCMGGQGTQFIYFLFNNSAPYARIVNNSVSSATGTISPANGVTNSLNLG